jgi:hypothetical protein
MWKYNNKVIKSGRGWSDDDGNQYPSNWLALTTDAEKKAVGLVWEDEPKWYDQRFYWSADKPKALDDVKEVDEDGKAVLDVDGNQLITLGLKSQYKAQTKATAKSLLESTDWYVVRKAEDSTTTIPTDVATYRAAVRTASGTIETAITNASDHAAFIALWDIPVDSDGNPTGNAPINDWPEPLIG